MHNENTQPTPRASGHPARRIIVPEVVAFNPEWCDDRGFMVNVPGPNFLNTVALATGNRAVGSYTARRDYDPVDHAQISSPHCQGVEVLCFSISETAIHQELTNGRKAIIRSNSIRVLDATRRCTSIWRSFFTPVDPLDLDKGFTKEWCMTAREQMVERKTPSRYMPSTLGEVFVELTGRIHATLLRMGYRKELDWESRDNDDRPFEWAFRLAQEESATACKLAVERGPSDRWVNSETDAVIYARWESFHRHCDEMRHLSRDARQDRQMHGPWLDALRQMIMALVELRNERFPGAEHDWS